MTKRVLLVDNYDSFTYNLVQALAILGAEVSVHRHDTITVEDAARFFLPLIFMTELERRCKAL